jgi:DnaJ-class molecular chaperone
LRTSPFEKTKVSGLPVPMRCLTCDGKGEFSLPGLDTPLKCSACGGTGWVTSTPSTNGGGGGDGGGGWIWAVAGLILLGLAFA